MNSLDIFSVRALMQALEQIHSTKDLCDLPQVLFSALKSLIPGAMVTFDQLDLKTRITTTQISEDSSVGAEVKTRVLELMPDHPVVPRMKSGAKGAIRVTDCVTQRQFRSTPHYCDTLRPSASIIRPSSRSIFRGRSAPQLFSEIRISPRERSYFCG